MPKSNDKSKNLPLERVSHTTTTIQYHIFPSFEDLSSTSSQPLIRAVELGRPVCCLCSVPEQWQGWVIDPSKRSLLFGGEGTGGEGRGEETR